MNNQASRSTKQNNVETVLRLLSRFALAALFGVVILGGAPRDAKAADENVMLILDASGSMWGQVDGKAKITIAREVVGNVLGDIGDKVNLGVMTYGHRKKGDCSDIETIIPVGRVNKDAYMSAIGKLKPKGKTPITRAVRKSADELRFQEEKATIILVSDGLETCEADPCALASELEGQGIDFTVHVVGFDLKNEDTTSLQCLAEETGGEYLAAENANQLVDAIGQVVAKVEAAPDPMPAPAPEPKAEPTLLRVAVVLSQGSEPIDNAYVYVFPGTPDNKGADAATAGASRNALKVEPGSYVLETKVGAARGSQTVEVKENQDNSAEIVLNAGLLSVKALAKEGGEPLKDAYIYIQDAKAGLDGKRNDVTAGNQRTLFTVPAGNYFALATQGKNRVGQDVVVKAGERTDVAIVLGAGVLKVNAVAEEGGEPVKDAYINIYEPTTQTDGRRKQITAGNQRTKFSIPAGNYFVTARVGAATVGKEIEVKAGELTEETIVLGVGALRISAIPTEGASPLKNAYVTIFGTEKSLEGKRDRVTAGNQRTTFKVPAGKYYVVVKADQAEKAQEIDVAPGALTEASIDMEAGALSVKADKGVYVTVLSATKDLEGNRKRITAFRPSKPVIFPAGKYLLQGKDKDKVGELEVEVSAGQLTEVELKVE